MYLMAGCGCGTEGCVNESCDCMKTGKCTCGPDCNCKYSKS